MEEVDKVCSAAAGGAPRDETGDGAAAAGETRAEEPLKETGAAQTISAAAETTSAAEVTSTPLAPEETSDLQAAEVTSTSQTAEETVSPQSTEKTSSPEIQETTSSPTEVTSAPQTAEETSSLEITSSQTEATSASLTTAESISQTTVETNPPQIADVTSPPQITEETSSPLITDVTSPPQITEETSSPLITDVTSHPQITEETSHPQITEETSPPQTTEVTSSLQTSGSEAQCAEETSPPEITTVTSPPQIPEVTSPSEITEVTSPPQITEVTSPPEITEVTSPPAAPPSSSASARQQDSSSRTAAEERLPPATEQESSRRTAGAPEPDTKAPEPHTEAPEPDTSAREPHIHLREPDSGAPEPDTGARAPVAHEPRSAPVLLQLQLASDRRDSPPAASANTELPMDPSRLVDSPALDPDLLSQSDDDLMFEAKKSPFQEFCPVSDGGPAGSAASDSPSPDLVQDAYDEEPRPDAALSYGPSDLCSGAPEDRPACLPDILKSSPLNPDKVDSGSSEGSPDFSPVHRSVSESPNSPLSASSPFGPDKILLLKEMVEDTEARAVGKARPDGDSGSEQSFVAFDLLKEMDVPASSENLIPAAERFCLSSDHTQEPESPSPDSFSPVLDAQPQSPLHASAEPENRAADELSEPEASSEEFEFVERPARGALEECVEPRDSPTDLLTDEELSGPESADPRVQDHSSVHTSSAALGTPGSVLQELCAAPVSRGSADRTAAPGLTADAVRELLYWRDVRRSALVLAVGLVLLLSLLRCSVVSVVSYSSLAVLSATVSYRTYSAVTQAVQKSHEGHPFRAYLDGGVCVSEDAVHTHSALVLSRINSVVHELRRLFLVEDLVDSLKFAGLLYLLTYVGSWFNGLTLLILALVGAFSGPVVYERHQSEIDPVVSRVSAQLQDVLVKIQAKVPGAAKKSE